MPKVKKIDFEISGEDVETMQEVLSAENGAVYIEDCFLFFELKDGRVYEMNIYETLKKVAN